MIGPDVIDGGAAAVETVGTLGGDEELGRSTLTVGVIEWLAVVTEGIEVDKPGVVTGTE